MDDTPFGLIELTFVFGLALAFLGYELYSVRRSLRDDARKPDVDRKASASEPDRHVDGEQTR